MKLAALFRLLVGCALTVAAVSAQASAILQVPPLFPTNNIWNRAIDTLPVDARSDAYVATIGATRTAHPDFGTVYAGAPNGIPYVIVPSTQPRVAVTFDYASESDPGPYPIPPDALIEGGPQSTGDRHVLIVDRDARKLYELFAAYPNADGTWHAGSGSVFDFSGNACVQQDGPRPMPRDCRSCRDWSAMKRSFPATSITRCASPLHRRATPTSGRRATRRRA